MTQVGGLDLFPPDAAIPIDDYTTSMAACGVEFETLDRLAIEERWPQFALPEGTVGLYQERGSIVPAARGTAAMQAQARRFGADAARPVAGARVASRTPTESGRDRRGDPRSPAGVVVCADAWTNQVLAGLDVELPLTVTLEQVTYFQPGGPDAVPAGPAAAVDLDGRPVLLRLPVLRRGHGQGGRGLQ